MIIVVDEPNSQVKYGSVVAAPYVSALFEKILPYLEFKSSSEEFNLNVENYVGMNINTAKEKLKEAKISYEIIGNGDTVLKQTPTADQSITLPLSKIILYTEQIEEANVIVPNLVGTDLATAIKTATNAGLSIRLLGAGATAPDSDDIICEQSLPPGESTKRGSVIVIRAINTKFED